MERKPSTSRLAALTLVLALVALLPWVVVVFAQPTSEAWALGPTFATVLVASVAMSLGAIVLGVASIIRISKKSDRLKGKALAWAGMAIATVPLLNIGAALLVILLLARGGGW